MLVGFVVVLLFTKKKKKSAACPQGLDLKEESQLSSCWRQMPCTCCRHAEAGCMGTEEISLGG